MENEASINEIGYLTRAIDTEMTIFERMKIKRSTIYKIFGALFLYSAIIISFGIFL